MARPGFGLGDFDLGRGGIDLRRALINKLRRRATLADERLGLFDRLGPPFVVADLEPACLASRSGGWLGFCFRSHPGRAAWRACVGVWLQLCGGGSWPFLRLELSGRVRMVSRRPAFF